MRKTIDTRTGMTLTLFPETTEQEITQNIYCILNTVIGSVPHLRDYGLDNSYLHQPMPAARSAFAAAIADAISLYEPRAQVQSVNFTLDPDQPGHLFPIVEVTFLE